MFCSDHGSKVMHPTTTPMGVWLEVGDQVEKNFSWNFLIKLLILFYN